jgi:hypothetical protein
MFKFTLGQMVVIDCSGEEGEVIGRCENINCENTYNIRYKAADGRATESWWAESALA